MLEKTPTAVPPVPKAPGEPGESTRQAYAADFRAFTNWCRHERRTALPASIGTVVTYLEWLAARGRKPHTIERALTSIANAQRAHGYGWQPHRLLRETLDGIRWRLDRSLRRKSPVTDATLRAMVGTCGTDLRGLRDRAILVVGWAGALRRSEIAALDVADVAFEPDRLVVTVRNKKKTLPVAAEAALCPVRSLRAWMEASRVAQGPMFRAITRAGTPRRSPLSGWSIACIVKRAAESLGLDPADFGGHSLRAGHPRPRSHTAK